MRVIQVEIDKCTSCDECIEECPRSLFRMDERGRPPRHDDPKRYCMGCGHCIAVCPSNAIIYKYDSDGSSIPEFSKVPYGSALSHLASRRSVRRYKKTPVPKEDIEAVLEAIRYAPSGSNNRSWNFIVITNPAKIRFLAEQTISAFKLMRKMLSLKWLFRLFLPGKLKERLKGTAAEDGIDYVVGDFERGKDRILFNAPCVIIIHSPSYGHIAGIDAGIVVTQGMLAAQARGLGTCWIGFLIEVTFFNRKLRKWLGIPPDERVWGVFTLGYPAVTYYRVPPRDKLRVRWLDKPTS